MIIEINKGQYLKIVNEISEYDKLIEFRLMSFKKIKSDNQKISNLLEITKKYTKIKLQNTKYLINKPLVQTDLYTIINAMISMILSDENNVFIHSSIVSKNNMGVLLLGTFGQGKTTLALEMEKIGFDINSSDHAHLFIKNNKLFMKRGSTYQKYENETRLLKEDKIISMIEIKEIFLLYGLCDNGIYKKTVIDNKSHIIKTLFPYLSWWANCPLMTDPKILLENIKYQEMFNFLTKLVTINKSISVLRGDKREIALEINRLITGDKLTKNGQ